MICKGLTTQMVHMAQVMDSAAKRRRECDRSRTCVWCGDPVRDDRTYPACEECREYRQVVAP